MMLSLSGMPLPVGDHAPRAPQSMSRLRAAGSVRRTMTLDVVWPDGPEGATRISGRARDIVTPAAGHPPVLLAQDDIAVVAEHRLILAVSGSRRAEALRGLAGTRAGNQLRGVLAELLDDERRAGTPLYLLLDDLAGTTLVSRWAIPRWLGETAAAELRKRLAGDVPDMSGVCVGLRLGSAALGDRGRPQESHNAYPVAPLADPHDPDGWHALADLREMSFRRARRIDLWREDGLIRIQTSFQDSAVRPDGSRVAVHEYHVEAAADGATLALRAATAVPGILPFKGCVAGPVNLAMLVGTPLGELRAKVIEVLRKEHGCTHLNDVMRSLAEVPVLARHLG